MRKYISLILVSLMILPALASCSDPVDKSGEVTTTPSVEVTTTEAETQDPKERLDLPELDFKGAEVRIISPDRDWFKDEVSVAEKNADVINDAIFDRNALVEDRLKVKIVNNQTGGQDNYAISNIIRNNVKAGLDEFDIVVNRVYSTIMYTGENNFHNLKEMKYINLEKPWWAQHFNASASYGNAQYFVTGPISLSLRRLTFVTFFNKNLFAENNIGDIYQVVRDGKWTMDYQHQIASTLYKDLNGDSIADQSDFYGFVGNHTTIGVDPYWSAFDIPILKKTADNFYEYSLDIEKMQNSVVKINNFFWNNTGVFGIKHVTDNSEQLTIAKKFSEGTAAMTTLRLIEAEGSYLRGMEQEYGIIPMPKYDEAQDDYYSFAHDQFTAYAVASTVKEDRFDLIGAFLEAFAYESHVTVTPAYYDVTLKTKVTRDVESAEMLDIIMANLKIDAGVLYTKNINSVHQMIRTVVASNNNNVTSIFTTLEKVAKKFLDKMQTEMQTLQ